MKTIPEIMVEHLNARVEAAILGTDTGLVKNTRRPGETPRLRDIERAISSLKETRVCVGMVCRPNMFWLVKSLAEAERCPPFGPMPVYAKHDQAEPCIAFYDLAELKRYLECTPK